MSTLICALLSSVALKPNNSQGQRNENETGHYQVREFQDRVKVTEQAVLQVPQFGAIPNAVSIFPQMEVLPKDTLAFRLLLPYNSGLGPVYRHLPLLFKPGPSPGAFIPNVSANFTASSGPVTGGECTYIYMHLLLCYKQRCSIE